MAFFVFLERKKQLEVLARKQFRIYFGHPVCSSLFDGGKSSRCRFVGLIFETYLQLAR